jgi:hypothetical protein
MTDLKLSIDVGFKNTPIDYLETIAYPLVDSIVVQLQPLEYLEAGLDIVLKDDTLTLDDPMMVVKYAISRYCGYTLVSPHGQVSEFVNDVLEAGHELLEGSKTLKYLVASSILHMLMFNARYNEEIDVAIFDALVEYTRQLSLIPIGVFFDEVEALAQEDSKE